MADRFPQPLKYQAAGTADDTLGDIIDFPRILGTQESANKRLVTEVIKVIYDLAVPCNLLAKVDQAAYSVAGARFSLSYRALTLAENDPLLPTATTGSEAVLDACELQISNAETAATTDSRPIMETEFVHDLSCGGYGILFPGHRLFLNQSSTNDLSSGSIGVSIYYRQHLVGLNEFMGIFASRMQHD